MASPRPWIIIIYTRLVYENKTMNTNLNYNDKIKLQEDR